MRTLPLICSLVFVLFSFLFESPAPYWHQYQPSTCSAFPPLVRPTQNGPPHWQSFWIHLQCKETKKNRLSLDIPTLGTRESGCVWEKRGGRDVRSAPKHRHNAHGHTRSRRRWEAVGEWTWRFTSPWFVHGRGITERKDSRAGEYQRQQRWLWRPCGSAASLSPSSQSPAWCAPVRLHESVCVWRGAAMSLLVVQVCSKSFAKNVIIDTEWKKKRASCQVRRWGRRSRRRRWRRLRRRAPRDSIEARANISVYKRPAPECCWCLPPSFCLMSEPHAIPVQSAWTSCCCAIVVPCTHSADDPLTK